MSRLRFGIFSAPFHPVGQNPTLALERDMELVEWLDRLGFDKGDFFARFGVDRVVTVTDNPQSGYHFNTVSRNLVALFLGGDKDGFNHDVPPPGAAFVYRILS